MNVRVFNPDTTRRRPAMRQATVEVDALGAVVVNEGGRRTAILLDGRQRMDLAALLLGTVSAITMGEEAPRDLVTYARMIDAAAKWKEAQS